MTAPTLQALIFDVDGTLADTERDGHRVAFNTAFREAGLDWDWDVSLYGELLAVTGGKERMRYYLAQHRPAQLDAPDIDATIAALHKAKTRHYVDRVSSGAVPLRPGVARLLDEARHEGLRLAIATTTTPENVSVLLEHSLGKGSSAWFECIGAGDIVPAKKPAPDIYHWVLEQMHLDPENALAFEDSENGLLAARGAALKTVVTVNDYTDSQNFDGAAKRLPDLAAVSLSMLHDWHREA